MRKVHQLGYQQRFYMLAMSLFSVINLGIINPALAQERLLQTLVVTGRGTEEVVTTKAQIQLALLNHFAKIKIRNTGLTRADTLN